MRGTKISAIILVGLLVIIGGCASPAATVTVAPSPAAAAPAAPVAPAPIAAAPAAPAAPAPVAAAPAAPTPVAAAPVPVAAPIPVPGQPVFIVSNIAMAPEACVAGDNVTVSVVVTNTGKERGTYSVVLKFDSDIVKTQDVTLDGGSSGKVELTVTPNVVGVYKVTINDQLPIKFEVAACPV